jgi:hypothetical protein
MNLSELTKAEYIKLAQAAKEKDINQRWIPRTEGLEGDGVSETCRLHPRGSCPLYNDNEGYGVHCLCCCPEFEEWVFTIIFSSIDSLKAMNAARKVLARIQAIDVFEWADELERRGVFKGGDVK